MLKAEIIGHNIGTVYRNAYTTIPRVPWCLERQPELVYSENGPIILIQEIKAVSSRKQQGFTLIEIMVVIVIIALLATLVLPRVMGRQEQAFIAKAKSDIQALSSALKFYKLDNFHYPTTDQGLEALVKKPAGEPVPKHWKKGGYIERLPKDPWGNPYQYLSPGEKMEFDLWSYGSDGVEGGEEGAADIGNWNID